jgi:hypothetical protein
VVDEDGNVIDRALLEPPPPSEPESAADHMDAAEPEEPTE